MRCCYTNAFWAGPFSSHRDSVLELVRGQPGISRLKICSPTRVSVINHDVPSGLRGFDQAPDFIIPSEFNPQAVIEAKLTEDDGTARDKVTRIQHVAELSMARELPGVPGFGNRLYRRPRLPGCVVKI